MAERDPASPGTESDAHKYRNGQADRSLHQSRDAEASSVEYASPELDGEGEEEEVTGPPPSLASRFFNLRTFISFGLGFAILLFLLTRVQLDVAGILDRLRQANPPLLLLALVVFYATFPVRALRWRRLLQNVGFHRRQGVRLPTVFGLAEIIFLSWFANCIVPAKLGDAYRAYLLKTSAGVSFSKTMGTVLAERIIDVLMLFGLMATAASMAFGRALPQQVQVLLQAGLVLVVLVVVGLLALRNLRPFALRIVPARFHAQYRRLEEGVLHSFRSLPYLGLLTLVAWLGEISRLYLVTAGLGFPGIAPSVIVFVALASALATTLPFTPAGLGVAEAAIVGVFILAMDAGLAPGLNEAGAASIALIDRSISYWSLVVFGLLGYLLSRRK